MTTDNAYIVSLSPYSYDIPCNIDDQLLNGLLFKSRKICLMYKRQKFLKNYFCIKIKIYFIAFTSIF
jgi:hypothetical protein